jgi:hypothetical protein
MTREFITLAHYPASSPLGPLRVDVPGVTPSDWEDEEEDED